MSTRALDILYNQNNEEVLVLYHHSDGNLSYHGIELLTFFKDLKLVNGIPKDITRRVCNGIPCCAAFLVKHFKREIGGVYLYPANTRDIGENYIYKIHPNDKGLFSIFINKLNHEGYNPANSELIMLDSTIQEEQVERLKSMKW